MTSELPSGWASATIDEVCDVVLGQSPPGSSYNGRGEGTPFLQGKAEFGDRFPNIRKWTTEPKKHASVGSVLLSVRAPVGPTNIAPIDCAIGRGLAALHPLGGISTEYLLWAVRQSVGDLVKQATGSTFEAITGSQLRSHRVVVAPIAEQERIVAAIEEHFSRLDAANDSMAAQSLRTAQLLESVLQTELGTAKSHDRPLSDFLTEPLANGRSVPTAEEYGFPVLRLTCLRDGWVDTSESKQGNFGEIDHRRYQVESGDFLISRGNGSLHLVGIGGLVPHGAHSVAYPDTLIRARVDRSQLRPEYLSLIWNSRVTRRQLESQARTTAGIYKVNQSMIGNVLLPVPFPDVQDRITRRLELVRQTVLQLDAEVDQYHLRSASLRRSILSTAFSGRLVPQNPDDESASVLLERIAASQTTKRKRRRPRHDQ